MGFIFNKDNCIQCHGCGLLAKPGAVALGVNWRRVINLWSGEYPHITCSSASIACMHCEEPACVDVCPTGAVNKRGAGGIVLVDARKCIGCQACLDACPFKAPQFGLDGVMQKCDMCLSGKADAQNFYKKRRLCVTHAHRGTGAAKNDGGAKKEAEQL